MTTVSISQNGNFVYSSGGLLTGERFCQASGGANLTQVVLQAVSGYNASSNVRYLQLFSLVSPAGVPLWVARIPADATFSFEPPAQGWPSSGLLRWDVSDTGPTYTASVDTFWVQAQGRAVCIP